MNFDLIPGNQEIIEILAAQVHGPYRFIHDAMTPYVRVEPASQGASITVHASDRLRLNRQATERTVRGAMDFMVMFDDAMDIRLAEVSPPDARVLHTKYGTRVVDQPVVDIVEPATTKKPVLMTTAEPPPHISTPTASPPVLPMFQEICDREAVDPTLGDYLVIPETTVSALTMIPPWVVRSSHVDRIHVVKPRLRSDTPIRSQGANHGNA